VELNLSGAMSGKKSRPTSVNITPPSASINAATTGTMPRRLWSIVNMRI
jgi:hypothetical protein